MNKEKFLPIGTVVLLKGGTKRIMITSYLVYSQSDPTNKKMSDYGACVFPEGIIDGRISLGFNHDQIDKVIYMGLEDEEQKKFNDSLRQVCDQVYEEFNKEFGNS